MYDHWDRLNKYAFRFLIGSFIALIAFFVLDIVISNTGLQTSSLFDAMFDFAKYVSTLFLGFLFGAKATPSDGD